MRVHPHDQLAGAKEKTRHKMTGNGWHKGTAMFLLFAMMTEPKEAKHETICTRETGWHRRGSSHTRHNIMLPPCADRQWDRSPNNEDWNPHGKDYEPKMDSKTKRNHQCTYRRAPLRIRTKSDIRAQDCLAFERRKGQPHTRR